MSNMLTDPQRDSPNPWEIRASHLGFRALTAGDYDLLTPFYGSLVHPLADLNALMMIAWRTALKLRALIEDGILYMLAEWSGKPVFWGPPVGNEVNIRHLHRAFELLGDINPEQESAQIRYVWQDYELWPDIKSDGGFSIERQSCEYLYDTGDLASLHSQKLKKKRYYAATFKRRYAPLVTTFSSVLNQQCLELLENWTEQKLPSLNPAYAEKFELERLTCEMVLREQLPLSGVAAIVDEKVQAFSIGSAHGRGCFNCMFEKTNLEMPGASAFIFNQLAKYCLPSFTEINAGEDWEVEYLREARQLWKPSRIQTSYQVSLNH